MRIGILGSGVVGRTLASSWAEHGHETRIGTRDAAQLELAAYDTGSFADVAAWAELVVLAVIGASAEQLARDLSLALAGKVVIDATNPLDFSSGGPQLFVGTDDSLGERVQRAAPDARVVKAYNTVGNLLMVDPQLDGGPPTMPIAGDDEDAKATVLDLLEQTGWDPIDLGGISASRWLEPMALVWTSYGIRSGTWTHAFRLLRG